EATRRAVEAAMQPKVKDRPASVAQFLSMLPGGEEYPVSAPKPKDTSTRIIRPSKPRPSKPHWAIWTAIIMTAIAAIAWLCIPQNVGSHPGATVAIIQVPPSSSPAEPVMIYAYTGGDYRSYTVADWDSFTAEQRAQLTPVGVKLTANGQQFVIAPTDAGGEDGYMWEDVKSHEDCVDIPMLNTITSDAEAKRDYGGGANTNAILSYGTANGIKFPAAEAAHNYSTKGMGEGWCLPASGQLWLMGQNKEAINNVLEKIGGNAIADVWHWSSTEANPSHAWDFRMVDCEICANPKGGHSRVRPCAPVR
ncbi:MAG: hypothetical protein NC102_08890, partial [Clostridium sp.]|nr:hypothetical protein [Clostridium sp.]